MNANSAIRVERRLKENLAFWKNIGASRWLLEIIEQGYCFPFIDLPAERQFPNHKIWGLFVGEQRLPQVLCIHCPAIRVVHKAIYIHEDATALGQILEGERAAHIHLSR